MTHRTLTASGLALAQACPASHALPAVDQQPTDAMRAGTQRHAWLDAFALAWEQCRDVAAARRDAHASALPADRDARATVQAIDVDTLLDVTGARDARVEVGVRVAWWPETDSAEELAPDDHRHYPDDPSAIHGTTDWVLTAPDGAVTVLDFKGSQRNAPAADHAQLALYALGVARARGLDSVRVALVYVHEDGSLERDGAHLDGWALDAWAAQLARVHRRVTVARAATSPGDHARVGEHCGRCPALRVCPAQVTLARELVAAPPSPDGLPALSDEDAGVAWDRAAALRLVLDRVEEALRVRARVRGLPLPDGRRVVPVESSRRVLDTERALPVLRGLVGDRAETLVERSLSAGAVDGLAAELAAAEGVAAKTARSRLWEQLRAAGACRESTYVQLRVRKAAES